MADLLMKAEDWRSRADELRELAARTKYRGVRNALLDMAATFDSQAANLTTLALRLRTTGRPEMPDMTLPCVAD
jgi:hypothetical protein